MTQVGINVIKTSWIQRETSWDVVFEHVVSRQSRGIVNQIVKFKVEL